MILKLHIHVSVYFMFKSNIIQTFSKRWLFITDEVDFLNS